MRDKNTRKRRAPNLAIVVMLILAVLSELLLLTVMNNEEREREGLRIFGWVCVEWKDRTFFKGKHTWNVKESSQSYTTNGYINSKL